MNSNTHMPAEQLCNYSSAREFGMETKRAQSTHCVGDCLELAKDIYEQASAEAMKTPANRDEISKRFKFLTEIAATDTHKEAEILLEHALALYELMNGQEHHSVAEIMLRLSDVYAAHGKEDSAEYMRKWARDILQAPKDEPTHEFFHLVGIDRTDQSVSGNA